MSEAEVKSSVEVLGPLKRRLRVEVPATSVTASLDQAFEGLRQRVRLRGFRPGKAPRPVLDRLYGQQVRSDVVERLVRDAYADALVRHKVLAVAQPEIVVEPLGEPGVLRFSATVEVRPEVTVSDIDGIEAGRPSVHVEDADVERVLTRLAENAAQLHPLPERERVEKGDIVTADISATVEGRALPELTHTGVLLEAGTGGFPGALEERLVGLPRGASQVQVSYPADYANAAVAGKTVAFTVDIKAVGEKHVPPVDDDLARRHGDYATLDDLRAAIRDRLRRDAEQRADVAVRDTVIDALISRHPFDAPEAMVDRRCDAMLESLDVRLPEGRDRQKALATLRQELRPRALRDVKAAILLDAIAAQRAIEVTEDEIERRIEHIGEAQEARARVQALYKSPERREALQTQMMREKALAVVVDRSKIRPLEPS